MTNIKVRELDTSEYILWDELVENSPHGTIYHTSAWLTICRDVLKKDLKIYGCFENDKLIGGCSLFVRKMAGILKVAESSCELTPYGGIVTEELPNWSERKRYLRTHQIMNHLRDFLCSQKFDSICIVMSPDFLDIRPFTWNGWHSEVRYCYYIDLEKDIDANLSKDTKQAIKKAHQSNIEVKNVNDYKAFYDLYTMTFEKQSLEPPVPIEFFKNLLEMIESRNLGYMVAGETEAGEIISAHIILHYKNIISCWATGTNPDSGFQANTLIRYNYIKNSDKQKFKNIDQMSANVERFAYYMTGFNPKLVPYYSINWCTKRYGLLRQLNCCFI